MLRITVIITVLSFLLFFVLDVGSSYEYCSAESGGGACPTGNTCCRGVNTISEEKQTDLDLDSSSLCIPNDLGSYNATCCHDDVSTGCAVGYQCVENGLCLATMTTMDPLLQVLPRYRLCRGIYQPLYGMSVREGSKAKFVYYSTHGDITNAQRTLKDVQMILIMIHGAGGNADDYFCSATAAIHHQTYFDPDAVLVVAPRFPTEKTTNIEIVDGGIAIRWGDGSDESGIWRYGQSATYPRWLIGESYSSFQALDALIQGMNLASLPLLRHVVIAGHSSGGQFVQRWALMTKVWNNSLFRGVVANPSSFAYLTEERWIDGKWMIPVSTVCPEYNQWPYGYGYDPGGNRSVFYVTSTVNELGQEAITRRFSQRKMFYLAGSLDVCTVPGNQEPAGWCDSHGLETSCSDLLQGQNRLERQQHNMESLARINVTHERIIISGVGHDHSLLFNSDLGLGALFDLESEGMLMSVS